jgi:hypothetical protein
VAHSLSATLERELAELFAPADRRHAHVMLTQYGRSPHEGYYLAAAQHKYEDVLYWAKHPDQAPQR